MDENLNVSAVITTYNRFNLAKRAINSILSQTYKPVEIIVVEDGSDSGIGKWLKNKDTKNIKYIRHTKNKGLAAARNTGLRAAKCNFIAFLDDDDVWKPERLEKQIKLLTSIGESERNNLGVIYCGAQIQYCNSRIIKYSFPTNSGNLKSSILKVGPKTIPSSYLFKKEILEKIGGFDEALPSSIDHDIWFSLAKFGFFAFFVREPLVILHERISKNTMMLNTLNRIQGVRLFLKKWKPILNEWMGNSNAINFIAKYLSRVIGGLAANKLIDLNFKDFFISIFAIYKYGFELCSSKRSTRIKLYIFILSFVVSLKVVTLGILRFFYHRLECIRILKGK